MNAKITLTCRRCRCRMEYSSYDSQLKDVILCQNCGQQLSEYDSTALRNALSALAALPDITSDGSFVAPDTGFVYSVKWLPSAQAQEELQAVR